VQFAAQAYLKLQRQVATVAEDVAATHIIGASCSEFGQMLLVPAVRAVSVATRLPNTHSPICPQVRASFI
jgi:hypothetical protein